MKIDPETECVIHAAAGEVVWDIFTRRNARIARVSVDERGNTAYWLECDAEEMKRSGGGRFPWEIAAPVGRVALACACGDEACEGWQSATLGPVRVAIRGFADDKLKFEDRIDLSEADIENLLPALAEKHAKALAEHELHMIEIEFLDEPDPLARYFRFGTDSGGMVAPMAIDLSKRPD